MPRFQRPCLVCQKLTSNGTRCEIHERQYKQIQAAKYDTPERQLKKKLLYGGDYKRRRQAALAGATHCHICKEVFKPGDLIETDHVQSGNPASPLLPAHRLCNQRKG